MRRAKELVREAFELKNLDHLPRGEFWLSKKLFHEAHLEDNLEGHLKVRIQSGMDILFLPIAIPETCSFIWDYRHFNLEEVKEALKISDLFVSIIIDGPFQRLVEKRGLLFLLTEWKQNERVIVQELKKETEGLVNLITQLLKLKVRAVMMADDLAYQYSTYLNPEDLRKFLFPFYSEAVGKMHNGGAYALFHSCGNIYDLIPQLISCGFDGLAGCEKRCLDLISSKKEYGVQLTFLAGIDADLLETESLSPYQKQEFCRRVRVLARKGRFILSSSCGISSLRSLQRLRELYRISEDYLRNREI